MYRWYTKQLTAHCPGGCPLRFHGPGIPLSEQGKVFRPYVQIRTQGKKVEGSSLAHDSMRVGSQSRLSQLTRLLPALHRLVANGIDSRQLEDVPYG